MATDSEFWYIYNPWAPSQFSEFLPFLVSYLADLGVTAPREESSTSLPVYSSPRLVAESCLGGARFFPQLRRLI